jgi:hypothetical protein
MTRMRLAGWMIGLVLVAGGAALFLFFRGANLQQQASSIQEDVSKIRGRSFVSPVVAHFSSREDTAAYIEAQLTRSSDIAGYGKVVRKLGFYNGPLIENRRAVMRQLIMSSPEGSVGYYDEKLGTVFVEKDARGSIPLERLAHEIYHAFQDQHFNVTSYLLEKSLDGSLSADEVMARRAVVEGEARYVAIVWATQRATRRAETPRITTEAIRRRSGLDREALMAMLSRPNAPEQARAILDVLQRTPAFLYDSLYVPYREGAVFVSSVQQAGWAEVEKLYSEYPPESTEQILHPQKWFARERPVRVKWPAMDTNPLFAQWKLLADNVLGEALWRSVFKEQGLSKEAAAAAPGWNGDRYAVLEREQDGALLLLWHTTWDTPADAAYFARTYRRLLETKYASAAQPVRVKEKGLNVFIVEGSDEASIDAYVGFVEQVQ